MQIKTIAFGYGHLEAPRVDDHDNLYFTDLYGGGLHRVSPSGRRDRFLAERTYITGIALNENGGVVLAGRDLIYWNEATGEIRQIMSLDGKPTFGVQDIQPDAQGSIWGGTYDWDGIRTSVPPLAPRGAQGSDEVTERKHRVVRMLAALQAGKIRPGTLFRVDPPDRVVTLWEGISIPNGMGFSPDGSVLYVNETVVGVYAYDVSKDRSLKNRRLFAKLPEGSHNGLAVDSEGGVLIAAVGAGGLFRFLPNGVLDRKIEIPARLVMSLEFGGKDLQDLYVVTGDNTEQPERRGTVFRMRSDVPGLPTPKTRF